MVLQKRTFLNRSNFFPSTIFSGKKRFHLPDSKSNFGSGESHTLLLRALSIVLISTDIRTFIKRYFIQKNWYVSLERTVLYNFLLHIFSGFGGFLTTRMEIEVETRYFL